MKYSVAEIKAVAEAAITTRHAADAAKTAMEAAPEDESLKTAYATAESLAGEAKTKADALSHETTMTPEQIAKAKRKKAAIESDLRLAGALEDDTEEDDDIDMDDPNRPLTVGDLQRHEARKATQTAVQMADTIEDTVLRDAVKDALKDVVPSGDSQADLKKAVAIANIDKNSKVLEEFGRKVIPSVHRSGAGAPPKPLEPDFEPTADEARFMRPPFNVPKEDILKSRRASQQA